MKLADAFLLIALFGAACSGPTQDVDIKPEQPIATIGVQAESLATMVPVEGTVRARRSAELSTRMMARISEITVDVGSQVHAGQTLVRLGVDDMAAKRMGAEAAVDAAMAAREEAERHVARMDTLYEQDAVPLVQRDGARLAFTQATAHLAMTRSALHEVETAETYATIRAPFDGFVVERLADAGDLANPGMPILSVDGTGPRDGVLSVPADLAQRLNIGDEVRVTARGGRAFQAPVRAISAGADPRSRTVRVLVALPDEWTTGTSLTALVPGDLRESVMIPARAVVRRGQLTGVRVVTDHGVVLRWVRLGRTILPIDEGPPRVEVLSGLRAGESIVP